MKNGPKNGEISSYKNLMRFSNKKQNLKMSFSFLSLFLTRGGYNWVLVRCTVLKTFYQETMDVFW